MNKLSILGCGNMGQAIAKSLLTSKLYKPEQLTLTTKDITRLKQFEEQGSNITRDNKVAAKKSEILILAVKPQAMKSLLDELSNSITQSHLVISISAGVTLNKLENQLPEKTQIVRAMPNIASSLGYGMTGWITNLEVTNHNLNQTKAIFSTFGKELLVDQEEKIDKITALAGSGPAYYYYFTEVVEQTALEFGFKPEEARTIAKQTLLGSAYLLDQSAQSAKSLRDKVTSKGGTTEAAINKLNELGTGGNLEEAIKAALDKAANLDLEY